MFEPSFLIFLITWRVSTMTLLSQPCHVMQDLSCGIRRLVGNGKDHLRWLVQQVRPEPINSTHTVSMGSWWDVPCSFPNEKDLYDCFDVTFPDNFRHQTMNLLLCLVVFAKWWKCSTAFKNALTSSHLGNNLNVKLQLRFYYNLKNPNPHTATVDIEKNEKDVTLLTIHSTAATKDRAV